MNDESRHPATGSGSSVQLGGERTEPTTTPQPTQTRRVYIDSIQIGERHRALSEDAVQRLARSMADIGLKQPISVRVVEEMELRGELCAGIPFLVAGAHRLAAAKSLGWSHIDCIEVEDDAITAEMWEIAENLNRHDLSKEQRDEHIRRYAELLTERREAIVAINGEQPRQPGRRAGGTRWAICEPMH